MANLVASNSQTWLSKAASAANRLSSRIRFAVEGCRERLVLEHELLDLEAQGDLNRVLSDAGLSRCQMPQLIGTHPGAPAQLHEMMARAGVDDAHLPPTFATGAALREMQWQCTACRSWRECRAWLASDATDDGYRAFCPNARDFVEMHDRQVQLG